MSSNEPDGALQRVRRFLVDHGASVEEIDQAEMDGVLDLLVADRLLVPTTRRYREGEVSERTGMPEDLARKFWRALGFSGPDPDEPVFTDLDVDAILSIERILDSGLADVDGALQLARVIGSSMARIAEAEVSPMGLGAASLDPPRSPDSIEAADLLVRQFGELLPSLAGLLEFAWRRHLQAATRRAMHLRVRHGGELPSLCVGFADMVDFTRLSQQLAPEELSLVVGRFEEVAHYTVTDAGGRLVKMIGDEAMFVTHRAVDAARIALRLAEAYAGDDLLSDVRVGLAQGPVLVQDGDYYGPVVNLAHAVEAMAAPGGVLMSDDLHSRLLAELDADGASRAEFAFRSIRPRPVKGLGRLQLWGLYRPGSRPPPMPSRLGRRWERLAEVLDEMDDLRARGEKVMTGGLRVAEPERAVDPGLAVAPGPRSGAGQAHGGDAEGAQLERPVHRPEGASPEVDEPA